MARANLESENEEDEHHGDSGVDKEDHDNGISSGVDDSEDEADDEKCSGASDSQASNNGSNDSDSDDGNINHYGPGETEENYAEGSDLTEISSGSGIQIVEAVVASGSRSLRKEVQHGRR